LEKKIIETLKSCLINFGESSGFSKGDLVTWKPYMNNRPIPTWGQQCVIVDIMGKVRVLEVSDGYSPYFMEQHDVIVGYLDDDGVFVTISLPSTRLKRLDAESVANKTLVDVYSQFKYRSGEINIGDIMVLKPNMKITLDLDYNTPVIIQELLSSVVYDKNNEQFDIIIGVMSIPESEFLPPVYFSLYYDSRRLQLLGGKQ